MMHLSRFALTTCCVLFVTTAQAAYATERITPDMISAALLAQGFVVQSSTRTMLGRIRIIAVRDSVWREIVLDSSTGQILRDYAVEFTKTDLPSPSVGDMPRGGDLVQMPPELLLQN